MTTRRCLCPDVVRGQELITLKSSATARAAAKLMNDRRVSSVLILDENEKLCGIFTVRDVARRIVGDNLDPDTTSLSQVMTKEPNCVGARCLPHTALRLMQDSGFRHLPVTEDGTCAGKVLGIVSRRNFFPEEETLLKVEEHLWESMR
jgi:CBS domain-containing protein